MCIMSGCGWWIERTRARICVAYGRRAILPVHVPMEAQEKDNGHDFEAYSKFISCFAIPIYCLIVYDVEMKKPPVFLGGGDLGTRNYSLLTSTTEVNEVTPW
jgi:hypothetical protein